MRRWTNSEVLYIYIYLYIVPPYDALFIVVVFRVLIYQKTLLCVFPQEFGSSQHQKDPVLPWWQQSGSSGRNHLWVSDVREAFAHQNEPPQRGETKSQSSKKLSHQPTDMSTSFDPPQTFYHGEPVPVSVEITNSSSRNIKDINVSGEQSGWERLPSCTRDVTSCQKLLPLFSWTGDQHCSLLQRQVCEVGGQRRDRVSQTLLAALFKILKLLHLMTFVFRLG